MPAKRVKKEENLTLKAVEKELEQRYGVGILRKGSDVIWSDIERIPTGSLALDLALGGGIPVGRVTELYGALSTAKSSMSLMIIGLAQKMGKSCLLIDEEGFNQAWAKRCGVDVDKLVVSSPEYGEDAWNIAEACISAGVDLIVVDSIAALIPKDEGEGDMEAKSMGLAARMNAQAMRKLQRAMREVCKDSNGKKKPTLLLINQVREAIGAYGNPEKPTGGRAIGFTASARVKFFVKERIEKIKNGEEVVVAQVVGFRIEKNKTAPPFRSGRFVFYVLDDIQKAGTVDRMAELIEYGVFFGHIIKGGKWYEYDGSKFDGVKELRKYLTKNSEAMLELEKRVLTSYKERLKENI